MLRKSNMNAEMKLEINARMKVKRVCSEESLCSLSLSSKALVYLFAMKSQSDFKNVNSYRDYRSHLHYSNSLSFFVSRLIQLTYNTRSLIALLTLSSNQTIERFNNHHLIFESVTILSQCDEDIVQDAQMHADFVVKLNTKIYVNKRLLQRKNLSETTRDFLDLVDLEETI